MESKGPDLSKNPVVKITDKASKSPLEPGSMKT